MKYTAIVFALLLVAGTANAALTRSLKGDQTPLIGGDVGNFIQTRIEDGNLKWSYQDGYTKGDPLAGAKGTPKDVAAATNYSEVAGPEWGTWAEAIIAVPDLFNALPGAIINGPDDILNVTMHLYQGGPVGGEIVGIYRITTPWLIPGVTGEDTVSAVHRLPGGEDPYWTADSGKTPGVDPTTGDPDYSNFVGFSSSDITTAGAQTLTLANNGDLTDNGVSGYEVDITDIAKSWFSDGNQGLALIMQNATWNHNDAPYFRDSEFSDTGWNIKANGGHRSTEFIVTYMPEPATMGLLIVGGIGALLRRKRR